MKNWRRRIAYGVIILAVLVLLVYGFRPQPVNVDTARAERGTLSVTVEEEGRTRVIDRFTLSAPVAAYARRVDLKVGDPVKRSAPLLTLEPLPSGVLDPRSRAAAEARVAAANAAHLAAKENAAAVASGAGLARIEHERVLGLRKNTLVSAEQEDRARAEAERTQAALRAAQLQVEVARHELDAAKTALAYSAAQARGETLERVTLSAPVDGRVLAIHRKSEGVVANGEPLIDVGDPHALEVEVDVLSDDAVRIRPGMRVRFERWGGDAPLEGVVRTVEPAGFTKISALGVEEQRVLVIADITSPPAQWERLGDGYRVEAVFILWEAPDVLQIPSSALFRAGGEWYVFTAEGDRARRHRIEIGHRNGLQAQVLGGLQGGETVIVHPDDTLEDGVRVETR
ncbi:MAG: HlyD family efflux transporter periplasmic adaptor subunit [Gammaproteobacteria bacterium]|nr:HlyD family efflux transporter periplasmic adaptor subunit [Gammaproteobacteria bacterium]